MSRYDSHFDATRSSDEDTSNHKFELAVNGPNLAHNNREVCEAKDIGQVLDGGGFGGVAFLQSICYWEAQKIWSTVWGSAKDPEWEK